jgi:hypothetical protein
VADYTVQIVVKCDDREVVHVTETFVAHDDGRALAGLPGWMSTILQRTNWHVAARETRARRSES